MHVYYSTANSIPTTYTNRKRAERRYNNNTSKRTPLRRLTSISTECLWRCLWFEV